MVLYAGLPWRQRRILGEVASASRGKSGRFVVVIPDGDVYVEDYSGRGRDVSAVRFAATIRSLPPGIATAGIYKLESDVGDLADARTQVEAAAEDLVGGTDSGPPDYGWRPFSC